METQQGANDVPEGRVVFFVEKHQVEEGNPVHYDESKEKLYVEHPGLLEVQVYPLRQDVELVDEVWHAVDSIMNSFRKIITRNLRLTLRSAIQEVIDEFVNARESLIEYHLLYGVIRLLIVNHFPRVGLCQLFDFF